MAGSAGREAATRTLSEADFAVGVADRYFETTRSARCTSTGT